MALHSLDCLSDLVASYFSRKNSFVFSSALLFSEQANFLLEVPMVVEGKYRKVINFQAHLHHH